MTNEGKTEDERAIRDAVDAWMTALDEGDLDGVLACCHDDIVMANGGAPTARGIATMRERYAPRIAGFDIESGWREEALSVLGDVGVIVGRYTVAMTPKAGAERREIAGRVALTYTRGADGRWRILADVDND